MKCPYCGATMVLRDSPYVYPTTKKAKDWGSVWVCENYPKCDTYVGCHKGTTIPLGRPANARLRTLKKEAHKWFDVIWQCGLVSRDEAYQWLADILGIPFNECHIGMFDIKSCQITISECKRISNPKVVAYREKVHPKEQTFTRGYKNSPSHKKKN